jgi:hypothetical protein
MATKNKRAKNIIGSKEYIDFPELGLMNIAAKIDTGAFSTALHCHDIHEQNGLLYFKLLDPTHPEYNEQQQVFKSFSQKEIKNSFGESELRYIIKTKVRVGRRTIKSVISLTNRGTMRYPVLVGRRLLKNRFIVDVSKEFIAQLNKKLKKKKTNK